jgi:hypothetical protein
MIKILLLLGVFGFIVYKVLGPKKVAGTIQAMYSDVKISSPNPASPGDSPENALIGPASYTY